MTRIILVQCDSVKGQRFELTWMSARKIFIKYIQKLLREHENILKLKEAKDDTQTLQPKKLAIAMVDMKSNHLL